jgi:hypothetical protein
MRIACFHSLDLESLESRLQLLPLPSASIHVGGHRLIHLQTMFRNIKPNPSFAMDRNMKPNPGS